MDLLTVVGVVIAAFLIVSLAKFLLHSLRTVFFVLLFIMVLVFFFGISIADIIDSVARVLLWVL